jgi:hypothetical protein
MEPRERLKEQVDQRSTQAGQQINTVADDVRSVAGELRTQGKDAPAHYAEQAAEKVRSVGQWLESSDGDKLVRDVEGFARRNPWAVAAGGLVLGLAASRFLKASSSERYRSSLSAEGDGANSGRFQREELGGTRERVGGGREEFGGGEFTREEGSLISTEPRA